MIRPVWAEIDLGAIRHNLGCLRDVAGVPVMAVVKADGYGHGAVRVAEAALEAGAERLAVAAVEEGAELRRAGIEATVHLLSEPPPTAAAHVVELGLVPTVYTSAWVDALGEAAARAGRDVQVHLKVDTGMHRVGASPDESLDLARRIATTSGLHLEGVWTHLAVADEAGHPGTSRQLELFDSVLKELDGAGLRPEITHAANSAGALGLPEARHDLVRVGIALYGILPTPASPDPGLRPAMSLKARVSYVKRVAAGERLSYGLTYEVVRESTIATVPLGYADGFPRALSNRGRALVHGRPVGVAGTVTMDQILLDCADLPVEVGDEVVLLGRQGDHEITANDVAQLLGTIGYEVVCGVGKRVPRVYL